MSNVLAPLEELPITTRQLVTATLRSGRQLLKESAANLTESQLRLSAGLWTIRRAAIDLRFLIARQGEEVFFFFVRRQLPTVQPLRARLQVSFQTAAPTVPSDEFPPAYQKRRGREEALYCLQIPFFLWARPSQEEWAQNAPLGTTADNGVLFRLGKEGRSVLGIRSPELGTRAACSYKEEGSAARLLTGWPVEPFLEFAQTLRAWLMGEQSRCTELDLELPSDPSQMSDVHVTLYWFVEGFRAMEAANQEPDPKSDPLAPIIPSYEPTEYRAEISLSVDEKGHFATAQSRDLVCLGMRLSVRRECGTLLARVALEPPDFLCSGGLRDSFLAALRQSVPRSVPPSFDLREAGVWSDFVSSAEARAVVFRVAKDGEIDEDVVILPGRVQGSARTLILKTSAVVDASAQPAKIRLYRAALSYDSQVAGPQSLDDETVGYFLRLARVLKDWLDLLA